MKEILFHPVIIGGENALKESALERRVVPELAKGQCADRILSRFSAQSAHFGTNIEIVNGVGTVRL